MHLFYVDESGSVADPAQQYFVLAGVAIFERKTHWVEQDLNKVANKFSSSETHEIELHVVSDHYPQGVRLFGAAVKKSSLTGQDPVEHAFEQLASRFDLFLKRLHNKHGDTQRGIMLFDESSTEQRIQTLAREFKYSGHTWGKTNNFAEVPVFLDSRASRLIQLADLVAYSLFRFHEYGDSSFYDVIQGCFDSEGGVVHGLYVRN